MKKEHEDAAPEEELQDVNFEPNEELGDVAGTQLKLKKLRDELTKIKQERQEYLDGWQRCKADSVNTRKETLLAAERMGERAKEGVIADIIPALDGFDMAAGSASWESVDAQWRSGIEHIRNQLLDALSRNGVERFGKMGDVFDHALHEAIEERDDAAGGSGTILRVLRAGYKLNGHVVRPAQVVVKK